MVRIPASLLLLLAVVEGNAQETPRTLPFLDAERLGKGVVLQPGKEGEPAWVEATGPGTFLVLEVENPRPGSHLYRLAGRIRYEKVEPPGYVEMWSRFADGKAYFSRTLAESGPMGKIAGTGKEREIVLPFHSRPGQLPTRLTVNIVLPGTGKVWLSGLTLSAMAEAGGWWTGPQAGLVGGIGGSVLGLLGGLIGFLAARGKARGLVMVLCSLLIGLGVVSLCGGLAALATGQPYHVWFPLVLLGVLGAGVIGGNIPGLRRRYRERELQQMAAMDA